MGKRSEAGNLCDEINQNHKRNHSPAQKAGLFLYLKRMKIAIQGTLGSYHHQAAIEFFTNQNLDLNKLDSFSKVAKSIHTEESEFGIMAIENSIAGTLLPNYRLITRYNLKIVGEVYLPIHHQFMVHPDADWESITEVHSHPMALLQCDKFLEKNSHFKIFESSDTASTAKLIADKNLKNIGAIASKLSAEIYGLKILQPDIQNIYKNSTRFFVLKKNASAPDSFSKVSLKFSTSHEKGALVNVLNEISNLDINMKKIQSVPIVDEPWQYAFHVDLELDFDRKLELLLERIRPKTTSLEILGCYQNAVDPIVDVKAYPTSLETIN